jgi:putative sugar O-methyltransferase
MFNVQNLQRAAADPARAFARLAGRQRSALSAKLLFRISQLLEKNPLERMMRLGDIALVDKDLTTALRSLRSAIAIQPTVSTIYDLGARLARSDFNDETFISAVSSCIADETLNTMFETLMRSPQAYHPSRFWQYFMLYNAFQIEAGGIDNFKRTANNNYFTWTLDLHVHEQRMALEALVGTPKTKVCGAKPDEWNEARWSRYLSFLTALYAYARQKDRLGVLDRLEEPAVGNPLVATVDGRRISQDLCHTTIELNSMFQGTSLAQSDKFTVYELGAGHGRICWALLSMFPNARYVIIDIPPALYVSQWYLSKMMSRESVFPFRDFKSYATIANEFQSSRLAFLLPHQAAMLPDKTADLFINICSIQEMTREHVALWFDHIDRLSRGYFYTKQYLEHVNGMDRITIKRDDYPVRPSWRAVVNHQCEGFPSLFESLYYIGLGHCPA